MDDRYNTRLDNKYGVSRVIDIPKEVAEHAPWFNQTLTQVNDAVVRLGILQGEYHWHKHDVEDECFIVLEGSCSSTSRGRRRSRSASTSAGPVARCAKISPSSTCRSRPTT